MSAADLIANPTYPGAFGTLAYVTFYIYTHSLNKFLSQLRVIYELALKEPEMASFDLGIMPTDKKSVTIVKTVEAWNATQDWVINVQAQRDYILKLYPLMDPYYSQPRETYFTDHMIDWTYRK